MNHDWKKGVCKKYCQDRFINPFQSKLCLNPLVEKQKNNGDHYLSKLQQQFNHSTNTQQQFAMECQQIPQMPFSLKYSCFSGYSKLNNKYQNQQYLFKQIQDSHIRNNFLLNILDWSDCGLLAYCKDQFVYSCWPLHEQEYPHTLFMLNDKKHSILSFKFNKIKNNLLAVGATDALTYLVDVATGQTVEKIGGHMGKIISMDWCGNLLGIGSNEGVISVRDIRENCNRRVLYHKPHILDILNIKWNSGNHKIASSGTDKCVTIFCNRMRKEMIKLKNYESPVKALTWSQTNPNLLISAGLKDGRIIFKNIANNSQFHLPSEKQTNNIVFSNQGNEMAVIRTKICNQVQMFESKNNWNNEEGVKKTQSIQGTMNHPNLSAISPSGELLATSSTGNIKIWKFFKNRSKYEDNLHSVLRI